MQLNEIEKLERYLIAKNTSYAVYGLTKNEMKSEFLLSNEEIDKYLLKRRFVYTIGEAVELLMKIEKNEREKSKK